MVGDPDLLFLDEPTTGLDPQSRRAGELIDQVDMSHLPPPEPRKTHATLEDLFVSLTGRTLRDE